MTKCHREVMKMPKSTFFNLSPEKREKIEKAIENEFGRTTFEKASISNIIENAKIPRGSFYQYFEDKEDAIKYIVQKYMKKEKEKIKNILIEVDGNIFDATIEIFEYMIESVKEKDKFNLYRNILEELKKNNINIFQEEKQQRIIEEIINVEILNINDKEDVIYMLKIVSAMARTISIEVITGKISKEEGKENLIKELEILKRGMLKNS